MQSAWQSWGVRFNPLAYRNPRESLLLHCEIVGDCWISDRPEAYIDGLRVPAQHAAYVLFTGPMDRRDEIIALCGNRRCCWAGHLHRVPRETIAQAREIRLSLPTDNRELSGGDRVE